MKKFLISVFIFLVFIPLFANSNQWGNLDLIYYFDSNGQREKVLENLDKIDLSVLSGNEKNKIIEKLIDFADLKGSEDKDLSKKIYLKVTAEAPHYWLVMNKLVDLESKGRFAFSNVKGAFSQMIKIADDFKTSFLMLNFFVNSLLYTILLVSFVFALIMLYKYFTLFANDLLINAEGDISLKKTLFVIVMFIWPLLFLSGWTIYPFLIFGVLFKYFSRIEKQSIYILFGISTLILLVFSFSSVLSDHYKSDSFQTERILFSGVYNVKDYSYLNNEQKTIFAFSEYKKNNFERSKEILNSVDDDYNSELRLILLGNLYYKKFKNPGTKEEKDLPESLNYFLKALRENDTNEVALNNLALVLLGNSQGEEDDGKVFDSYSERYSKLSEIQTSVLKIKDPVLDRHYLWKRLFSLSETSFNPITLSKSIFLKFVLFPFIYFILIFYIYVKFLNKMFNTLGESTACSKCSKIIKKKAVHKSYKFCEDCHQLFLIKDIIFLEAKLLKEKEIKKRNFRAFIKIIFLSIIIPGLNFNFKNKNNIFLILSMIFYFFLIFGFTGFTGFKLLSLPVPFIFNISGIIASILYLVLNISSIKGEDYGI